MALDERARNRMHNRLRDVMGDDVADTMMETLANKDDLVLLKQDLQRSLETLEHKLMAHIEGALQSQTRTYVAWTTGLTAIIAGVFTGVTTVVVR